MICDVLQTLGFDKKNKKSLAWVGPLNRRQFNLAHKIATGMTNKEIARDFGTSPRTVDDQRCTVIHKLGCRNTTEVARLISLMELHSDKVTDMIRGAKYSGLTYGVGA
jgi:DNA-binding NarL/FixJ family response regulator